jgi:hypothetical protein
MVGWWPGDGNAKDITPHDHDGTFTDDNVFVQGEVGQAFSFDGVDDVVDIPNAADLNIPTGTITLDAWINVTANGNYPSVLGKGDVGSGNESYALFVDPSGNLGFLVNTAGLAATRRIVIDTTPIQTGKWTFVAGTYDGTNVRVYVNGSLRKTMSYVLEAKMIHSTTNDLLIGKAERTGFGGTSYFKGAIDEVELFSRALSLDEIMKIYNAKTAGKCKCQENPDEADGDIQNDDTSKSHVMMTAKRNCDDNGEVDYTDDSGEELKGKNTSVATSGNTAMVNGQGNLRDGTPVYYTIVMVGNQPLIGMNLFSITWNTPAGKFFHKAGAMINGISVVPPQQ